MIAKLSGLLDSVGDGTAIIDVGGVGYLVFASSKTLSMLGDPGGAVSLYIETNVREDHIHLYGFSQKRDQECFNLLQTVQGVGAKAGLSILSALSADEVFNAIAAQDKTMFTRADGVGPKLGQRIVNELKDKTASIALAPSPSSGPSVAAVSNDDGGGATQDAVSALVNLGYGRTEAFGAVARAANQIGEDAALDQLITAGLKELAQ